MNVVGCREDAGHKVYGRLGGGLIYSCCMTVCSRRMQINRKAYTGFQKYMYKKKKKKILTQIITQREIRRLGWHPGAEAIWIGHFLLISGVGLLQIFETPAAQHSHNLALTRTETTLTEEWRAAAGRCFWSVASRRSGEDPVITEAAPTTNRANWGSEASNAW